MKIQINIDGKNIDAEISEEDAKELGLLDKRPQTGYERVEEKECYFVIGAAGDVSKQIECKAISDQRRRDCGNYYNEKLLLKTTQEQTDYYVAYGNGRHHTIERLH